MQGAFGDNARSNLQGHTAISAHVHHGGSTIDGRLIDDNSNGVKPTDILSKAALRCILVVLSYIGLGWLFFGVKYGWSFV
jgi:hypothetical protein